MSIFKKGPSLEQQLTQALADLTAANTQLSTTTAERDAASARVAEVEPQLASATAERDAAAERAVTAETCLAAANAGNASLLAAVRQGLGLTEEQAAALSGEHAAATISAAIDAKAGSKAVAIAASQGTPPVPTLPTSAVGDEDDAKLIFQAAAKERDPVKRAHLHAKASALVAKKAKKSA